ncbi:MAG: aryl-sulfate sulfotransferase [Terriglobales bacterium]
MLDGRLRVAGAGLIAFWLTILVGCGASANSVSIYPAAVLLAPGQTFQFDVVRTGNSATSGQSEPAFLVNGVVGGSTSTGTITAGGLYTAPSATSGQQILVSLGGRPSTSAVTIFNSSNFAPGSVATTQNPLVAAYSITAPAATPVQVQFGTDTSYGFSTSAVPAPPNGGTTTVLVAGMRASTTYHMQAIVNLTTGVQALDKDQTFTTGPITAEALPIFSAQQFAGGTQSPGVELFSLFPDIPTPPSPLSAVATDLAGNIIWYYDLGPTNIAFPIKPLPNGHMMVNDYPEYGTTRPAEIREIDLAGNIINRITLDSINQGLTGVASFQLASLHHDFAALPNGHVVLIGNYSETINNVPGVPPGTSVTGDALVDWDPQKGPVWTWSTFDHLDLTHAPYGNADWTHSNAIIYSPDDGNLILSMRNQNWIIKINYQNGAGDGSILWRFGYGGDIVLSGQEAPIDWNYGQHYPTIVSPNSAGVISLMFFDNGNNRLVDSNNDVCGSQGATPCYSSVPIFQLDESTQTANLMWQDILTPFYSICCGDALLLPNGNTEFDIAYDLNHLDFSFIQEVTSDQQLIWQMSVEDQLAYRGFRVPSLYPDQTWPAAAAPMLAKSALNPSKLKPNAVKKTIEQLP